MSVSNPPRFFKNEAVDLRNYVHGNATGYTDVASGNSIQTFFAYTGSGQVTVTFDDDPETVKTMTIVREKYTEAERDACLAWYNTMKNFMSTDVDGTTKHIEASNGVVNIISEGGGKIKLN
tara:strand:+ start:552 stop:914 length:363 start_codon:yes stop_codon:yes gene_type:complete